MLILQHAKSIINLNYMERLYKTLWVCAFLGFTTSANAQTDVTSQYLKNADFET